MVYDALSRRRHELSSLILTVDLKDKILQNLSSDRCYQDVKAILDSGVPLEGRLEGFSLNPEGFLLFKGNCFVPESGNLRELILLEAHKAPYSAHPGVKKMYADLKQHYFWPGMKKDIADFVARCLECQRVKAEHQHLAGLL